MRIYCKKEQKKEIKEIIQAESGKRGFEFYLTDLSDDFSITELVGDYCLKQEIDEAAESCREMLAEIKHCFPDVRINGNVSIGNKNYRITYIFESPEQSQVVTAESTFEYVGIVPASKCWFSACINGNYGPEMVGFVTREDFERFIEITRKIRKKHGLSFEDFIKSDLLEKVFSEDTEDLFETSEDEDCTDKAFVITGKLKQFENRDEFVEYIEDLGGRVVGGVSAQTDFLICNDTASTSSKMKKAKELGVEVITEEEFIRRFGDPDEFDLDDEVEEFLDEIDEFPVSTWEDELHALYISAWEQYKSENGRLAAGD